MHTLVPFHSILTTSTIKSPLDWLERECYGKLMPLPFRSPQGSKLIGLVILGHSGTPTSIYASRFSGTDRVNYSEHTDPSVRQEFETTPSYSAVHCLRGIFV